MAITYQETKKRLTAARALFDDASTTREKFNSVRTLVKDIHPNIDTALAKCAEALATLDKIKEGDVIMLSAENLPENTDEQKKRKKYLLLFITNWRQLKREIIRVEAELEAGKDVHSTGEQASMWHKIFGVAKGPLGVITLVALGVVGIMQVVAVDIVIENNGCATLHPSGSIPITIPGFSLPSEPIASGESAVVTVPGLTVNVDGTMLGILSLKVLTYSLTLQLPNNVDSVSLNDIPLLGQTTSIPLSEHSEHRLVLECS
jgi:hypothetical protein